MSRHRLVVLGDGTSIHTQKWIEGLSLTKDWDIYLISMNPSPSRPAIAQIPGVKECFQVAPSTIEEGGRNYQYLLKVPELRRLVRKIDPDIITTIYLSSYGLMGSLVKGRAKVAHFVVGSDIMVFPDQGFLPRQVTSAVLKRADLVISASSTMTKKMTEDLGCKPEKIMTQQYGVGDALIQYPDSPKEYDFVSNRAWVANSNIDYFLEALKRQDPTHTALIGDTVPGSEALGARILNLIRSIPGCRELGTLPYEDNINRVAQSKFLVSLTSSDGASLSVMEAMAVGTIPILSDILPNREWVTHGKNGFLVPLNQVEEAAAVLKMALAMSSSEVAKMAQLNREIIKDRGSLTKNMGRASKCLKSLLSEAPQPLDREI